MNAAAWEGYMFGVGVALATIFAAAFRLKSSEAVRNRLCAPAALD